MVCCGRADSTAVDQKSGSLDSETAGVLQSEVLSDVAFTLTIRGELFEGGCPVAYC